MFRGSENSKSSVIDYGQIFVLFLKTLKINFFDFLGGAFRIPTRVHSEPLNDAKVDNFVGVVYGVCHWWNIWRAHKCWATSEWLNVKLAPPHFWIIIFLLQITAQNIFLTELESIIWVYEIIFSGL